MDEFTKALISNGFVPTAEHPVQEESDSEKQWTYYGPRGGTEPWLVEQFQNDGSWLVTTLINGVMHQGCGDNSLDEAMADLAPIQKTAARLLAMLGIH